MGLRQDTRAARRNYPDAVSPSLKGRLVNANGSEVAHASVLIANNHVKHRARPNPNGQFRYYLKLVNPVTVRASGVKKIVKENF